MNEHENVNIEMKLYQENNSALLCFLIEVSPQLLIARHIQPILIKTLPPILA